MRSTPRDGTLGIGSPPSGALIKQAARTEGICPSTRRRASRAPSCSRTAIVGKKDGVAGLPLTSIAASSSVRASKAPPQQYTVSTRPSRRRCRCCFQFLRASTVQLGGRRYPGPILPAQALYFDLVSGVAVGEDTLPSPTHRRHPPSSTFESTGK